MTRRRPPRITVVGAGVVGLSCAVRLARAGHPVDVLARDLPPETTSAVAGGLVMPVMAGPPHRVAAWTLAGLEHFRALAAGDPDDPGGPGVRDPHGLLVYRTVRRRPAWADALGGAVALTPVERPAPGRAEGWDVRLPLVDVPRYLAWLRAELHTAGGTLTRLPLSALPARGIVVNATGVAARSLAADPSVSALRGQTVVVRNPGLSGWWVDQSDDTPPTYVLPHGDHVVVGGTVEPDDYSTLPDPSAGVAILQRASAMVPALADAEVLAHHVGLRPRRPQVRLELEHRGGEDPEHRVVHCYGHGGCGVTLAWGCAGEVVDLLAG